MNVWIIFAFVFAVLEVLTLWKSWTGLEYVAKPAVIFCLFLWLYFRTSLQGLTFWFGMGLVFSLVGDMFLMMSPNRMFIFGLVAFLFVHISYLTGFQNELMNVTAWSLLLIVILLISILRVMRRIVSVMRAKGQAQLVSPVILYSLVISLMLYAAISTISNPMWKTNASFFVSVGAFLFYISDLILAWNKFVTPIKNGRIISIAAYHLGQIGLIAGVISHFG